MAAKTFMPPIKKRRGAGLPGARTKEQLRNCPSCGLLRRMEPKDEECGSCAIGGQDYAGIEDL